MRRMIVTVLLALAFAFPGSANENREVEALERQLVESVDESRTGSALAVHFHSKAAVARENAELQERMGSSSLYGWGNAGQQRFLKERRAKLARRYREQAAAYEAQARRHEADSQRTAALRAE